MYVGNNVKLLVQALISAEFPSIRVLPAFSINYLAYAPIHIFIFIGISAQFRLFVSGMANYVVNGALFVKRSLVLLVLRPLALIGRVGLSN